LYKFIFMIIFIVNTALCGNFYRLDKMLTQGVTAQQEGKYSKSFYAFTNALQIINRRISELDISTSNYNTLLNEISDSEYYILKQDLARIMAELDKDYLAERYNSVLKALLTLKVICEKAVYLLQQGNKKLIGNYYCKAYLKYSNTLAPSITEVVPQQFWLTNRNVKFSFKAVSPFAAVKKITAGTNTAVPGKTADTETLTVSGDFLREGTNNLYVTVEDEFGAVSSYSCKKGYDASPPAVKLVRVWTNQTNLLVKGMIADKQSWIAAAFAKHGSNRQEITVFTNFKLSLPQSTASLRLKAVNFAGLETVTNFILNKYLTVEPIAAAPETVLSKQDREDTVKREAEPADSNFITNYINITNRIFITNYIKKVVKVPSARVNREQTRTGRDKNKVYFDLSNIYFDVNSSGLSPFYAGILKKLAAVLKLRQFDRIEFTGYADIEGSDKYNKNLSRQRAETVAGFLEVKAGIPRHKIIIRAKGSSSPIAPNRTPRGKAKNRRVEIRLFDYLRH